MDYSDTISNFINGKSEEILGKLVKSNDFALEQTQRDAWLEEINILQMILQSYHGSIYFEYSIPRMGKRIDVVVIIGSTIFILEFKVGKNEFPSYAIDQVLEYALDLKNFHETSHERLIVPILVATEAKAVGFMPKPYPDGLYEPLKANHQVIVDCSTSEPESTASLREQCATHGVSFVDAPLARTPIEAELGRLNVMVGADGPMFARLEPLLRCFAENVLHVGGPGAGHTIKLLNNFIAQAICTATAEAFAVGQRAGVEPKKLVELIGMGAVNSGIFQMMAKALDGDPAGLRFELDTARKDIRSYTHLAESLAVPTVVGEAVQIPVIGVVQRYDFTGLDLSLTIEKNPSIRLISKDRKPKTLTRLVKQGCLGVKAGKGFYDYPSKNIADLKERDKKLIKLLKFLEKEKF